MSTNTVAHYQKPKKRWALQLATAFAAVGIATAVSAATDERWFEVELVLFSQLNDKQAIRENFPDDVKPKQSRRVLNLIEPGLKPDISQLKLALFPSCNVSTSFNFLGKQLAPDNVDQLPLTAPQPAAQQTTAKAVNSPSDSTGVIAGEFETSPVAAAESIAQDDSLTLNQTNPSETNSPDEQYLDATPIDGDALLQLWQFKQQTPRYYADIAAVLTDPTFAELTPETGLVFQHQQQLFLTNKQVLSRWLNPRLNQSTMRCPTDFNLVSLANLSTSYSHFNENDFVVDRIPLQVTGTGNDYATQPYLLRDDQLQLTKLLSQLKRSREFRPLLHLAWRQPMLAEKQALPLKIVAGNNVQAQYQQALSLLNWLPADQPKAEMASPLTLSLNEQLVDIATRAIANDFEASQQLVIAEKAFNKVGFAQPATEIDALDAAALPALTAPLQDWTIQGEIKIHLDHYLYISGEFTTYDSEDVDFSEQATHKLIKFAQANRRVISGQIHYFDHPYMGMVIQIRKYNRPNPAEDNKPSLKTAALTSNTSGS